MSMFNFADMSKHGGLIAAEKLKADENAMYRSGKAAPSQPTNSRPRLPEGQSAGKQGEQPAAQAIENKPTRKQLVNKNLETGLVKPTYVAVPVPPPILENLLNEEKQALELQIPWGEAIRAPPHKPAVEIESAIYTPLLLGSRKHGGAATSPNVESAVYSPQGQVFEGLLVAEGGEGKERVRKLRPLYT